MWSRDGIIAVGNAFKERVNITFANGAKLPDPKKLFNAGFETLVRAAIEYNQTHLKRTRRKLLRLGKKRQHLLAR